MSGNIRASEKATIISFVDFLRAIGNKVEDPQWVDGVEEGSGLPDAVAHPYVIELFSIDNIPDERARNARFGRVISSLTRKPIGRSPDGYRISWSVDAIQEGQDLDAVSTALLGWFAHEAPFLPDGIHSDVSVKGLPFQMTVCKNTEPRIQGVLFERTLPVDAKIDRSNLQSTILKKAQKIQRHIHRAAKGLLLIESPSSMLWSAHECLEAYQSMFRGPPLGCDECWFFETDESSDGLVLNPITGDLYLFDRASKAISHATWICVG